MRMVELTGTQDGPQRGVQCGVLDQVACKVAKSRRIIVVTGAGVSCSAGIPDFRSKDGLYNLVKKTHPNAVTKGQDLFDCSVFRSYDSACVFNTFMANLRAEMKKAAPTPFHQFLRHLSDKNRLHRVFTQNIDGFETRAGLEKNKVVLLHGDIHRLRCTNCKHTQDWTPEYEEILAQGMGPTCPECKDLAVIRELEGKRARAVGVLRPTIVLYGEEHPEGDMIGTIASKDARARPDMLLVLGTSLKVDGIKHLVKDLSKAVKARNGLCVFVNATPVSTSQWDPVFDYHIQGGADEWVSDLKQRIPDLWRVQTRLSAQIRAPKITKKSSATTSLRDSIEKDLRTQPEFGVFQVNPQQCAQHQLVPVQW